MTTPSRVSAWLAYTRDDQTLRVTLDAARVTCGRQRHCDLIVKGAGVSRRHFAIERDDEGWWIEDLDSTHGTFVNEERITRRRLRDGDHIHFGRPGFITFFLMFHHPAEPAVDADS